MNTAKRIACTVAVLLLVVLITVPIVLISNNTQHVQSSVSVPAVASGSHVDTESASVPGVFSETMHDASTDTAVGLDVDIGAGTDLDVIADENQVEITDETKLEFEDDSDKVSLGTLPAASPASTDNVDSLRTVDPSVAMETHYRYLKTLLSAWSPPVRGVTTEHSSTNEETLTGNRSGTDDGAVDDADDGADNGTGDSNDDSTAPTVEPVQTNVENLDITLAEIRTAIAQLTQLKTEIDAANSLWQMSLSGTTQNVQTVLTSLGAIAVQSANLQSLLIGPVDQVDDLKRNLSQCESHREQLAAIEKQVTSIHDELSDIVKLQRSIQPR